jgi:hypothetical protein
MGVRDRLFHETRDGPAKGPHTYRSSSLLPTIVAGHGKGRAHALEDSWQIRATLRHCRRRPSPRRQQLDRHSSVVGRLTPAATSMRLGETTALLGFDNIVDAFHVLDRAPRSVFAIQAAAGAGFTGPSTAGNRQPRLFVGLRELSYVSSRRAVFADPFGFARQLGPCSRSESGA